MSAPHFWPAWLLAGTLALGFCAAPAQEAEPPHEIDWSAAEKLIASERERWDVPGIAVSVVDGSGRTWTTASGVLGLDNQQPVNPQTVFAIGSCTKAFTAAALLMLADEGRLDLDKPVSSYFESLKFPTDELTQQVTLRDLLSHRTGLPSNNLMFWNADVDREALIERIRFLPPRFPLGQRFQYQNVLYLAVGQTIPAVTGQNWDDFVTERLLESLEMKASHASLSRFNKTESRNIASAHIKIDGRLEAIPRYDGVNIGPAGAIHSNVVDMARWVAMLLRGGVAGESRILNAKDVEAMYAPEIQVPKNDQASMLFPFADSLSYGLGWFAHEYHGHQIVEHGGTSDGMSSWVLWMPEEDLGVVVLTNSLNVGVSNSIAYRIADWLGRDPAPTATAFEKITRTFNSMLKVARFRSSNSSWTAAASPDRCAGRFENALYGGAEIRAEGRKLSISLLGRQGALHPAGGSSFQVDWGNDLFLMMAVPKLRFAAGKDPSLDSWVISGQAWPRKE